MAMRGIGQADDSPVSKSAMLIVTACAVVSQDPVYAKTYSDPYAAWFASAISDDAAERLPKLKDAALRAAFIKETEKDLDGLVTHVVYRKPWITDQVRKAVDAGIGQLVILGAGCDTLSLRLGDALAGATVFELDRAPVIDFRRRVLGEHAALADNVRLLAIDFDEDDAGAILDANGFDRNAAAVLLAEGVTEYLTAAAVERLFQFVREMCAPGSRFIFSFLANKVYEQSEFDPLIDELAKGGEPLKFGLVAEDIDGFLAARGFRALDLATPETIARDVLPAVGAPVGIIPGWHLVSAARNA